MEKGCGETNIGKNKEEEEEPDLNILRENHYIQVEWDGASIFEHILKRWHFIGDDVLRFLKLARKYDQLMFLCNIDYEERYKIINSKECKTLADINLILAKQFTLLESTLAAIKYQKEINSDDDDDAAETCVIF